MKSLKEEKTRDYSKWAKIELKLWLEELKDKEKANLITSREKVYIQEIEEELNKRIVGKE